MTCGFDLGCYFEPAVTLWQTIVGIWRVWWPVALFDAGMIVGALLGIRIVLGINTVGAAFLVYDRFKPIPAKDKVPAPKKPKEPRGDSSVFEDFINRWKKK